MAYLERQPDSDQTDFAVMSQLMMQVGPQWLQDFFKTNRFGTLKQKYKSSIYTQDPEHFFFNSQEKMEEAAAEAAQKASSEEAARAARILGKGSGSKEAGAAAEE